jgi:hypothetical protein
MNHVMGWGRYKIKWSIGTRTSIVIILICPNFYFFYINQPYIKKKSEIKKENGGQTKPSKEINKTYSKNDHLY